MPLNIVFLRAQNWSRLKPYYQNTITAVKEFRRDRVAKTMLLVNPACVPCRSKRLWRKQRKWRIHVLTTNRMALLFRPPQNDENDEHSMDRYRCRPELSDKFGSHCRRTNVQQLTCNIDLSSSFYYLFLSFVLIELKPSVLKGESPGGKILKKCEKVRKSAKNYETILPFSCCPLVFPWHWSIWISGEIRMDQWPFCLVFREICMDQWPLKLVKSFPRDWHWCLGTKGVWSSWQETNWCM